MHSTHRLPHSHVAVSAPCSSARPLPTAAPSLLPLYDADTIDALMLFHTPSTAIDLEHAQPTLKRDLDDETRRRMHREVQRRFVQRKKAAFEDLRRRARTMELRHRTLLLRLETEKLRKEHKWLVRRCKVSKRDVEEASDDESDDESDEDSDSDCSPRGPRLFEFHLTSGDTSED